MCKTLNQVHACGHIKPICITPCPHATATSSYPNPFSDYQPTSPTSPTSSNTQVSPHYQPPQLSAATSYYRQSYPSANPNHLHPPHPYTQLSSYDPQTNYCAYFIPHNLPPSKYPCLVCYMRREWQAYRDRWVNEYRVTHPGTNAEMLEELSGVKMVPDRVGLINVDREMRRVELGQGVRDGLDKEVWTAGV